MSKPNDQSFSVVVLRNGRVVGCSTPTAQDRCKGIAQVFNRHHREDGYRAVARRVVEI